MNSSINEVRAGTPAPMWVFAPEKVLKRIRKLPKASRGAAIQEFKQMVVLQRAGWARCRSVIARALAANPDTSRDALMSILLHYREDYSFGDKEMHIAVEIIDDYRALRNRLLRMREKYVDDRQLTGHLTDSDVSDIPLDELKVNLGPMSFDIITDVKHCNRFELSGGVAGFARRSRSGVYLTVMTKGMAEDKWITSHEQQHVRTGFLHSFVYPKRPIHPDVRPHIYKGISGFLRRKLCESIPDREKFYMAELFCSYVSEKDANRKLVLLREYCLALRDHWCRRAADELLAVLSEPIYRDENTRHLEMGKKLTTSGSNYDYFSETFSAECIQELEKDPSWVVLSAQLLIDEYRKMVLRAVSACSNLLNSKYYRSNTDDHPNQIIIALLTDKPLSQWPLEARRSIELQDLACSKTEL